MCVCVCVWNAMALCICPVLYVNVASIIFCSIAGKGQQTQEDCMLLGKLTHFHMFALREKLNVRFLQPTCLLVIICPCILPGHHNYLFIYLKCNNKLLLCI